MKRIIVLVGLLAVLVSCNNQSKFKKVRKLSEEEIVQYTKWEGYNGGNENIKYSSLKQINSKNVKNLQVAWTYSSSQASETNRSDMKVNPLIVNGILYGLNPELKLFALDAATGEEKWVYNPLYVPTYGRAEGRYGTNFNAPGQTHISRGLAYYDGEGDPTNQRILYAPGGGHMIYCVDASNGRLISSFGKDSKIVGKEGFIDLHEGGPTDRIIPDKDLHVSLTTPGIIYKDIIIVGSRNNEGLKSSMGHVKAFDVNTGELRWIFHTVPQPGEANYDTWPQKDAYKWVGGGNAWGGMALDDKRGIVFATIGSITDDFYGGFRLGMDLYADCILALDANNGKLIWYFQTIHHNLWDWDLCANPPSLAQITEDNGEKRDVVICTSKQGLIYMFDRVTGDPIHPIVETPVPTDTNIPGEEYWPTQPIPTFFKPFSKTVFKEEDLLDDPRLISDSSYQIILKKFRELRSEGLYTPSSPQGTIVIPGWNGGNDWGGPSIDPETGIMYIVDNTSPWIQSRIPIGEGSSGSGEGRGQRIRPGMNNLQAAEVLYRQFCMGCHGADMRGGETNPGLGPIKTLVGLKYDLPTLNGIILNGVGTMYGHSGELGPTEVTAISAFTLGMKTILDQKFVPSPPKEEPWFFTGLSTSKPGYNGKFLTPEGYPAIKPPWCEVVAVNLNTGEELWRTQIGGYKELIAKGIYTGSENFGASVITAGGLVFVSGGSAETILALDKITGELLWEAPLPHAAVATPSVYEVNGRQYVVIACGGGGKQATKSGDEYVAFALPD